MFVSNISTHDVIKLKKCQFAVTKIEYLSHIIENGTMKPNTKKTAHVRDMPVPRTVRILKGFLGYSSYYRRYIQMYSSIASPLIRSTIKTTTLVTSVAVDVLR